MRSRLASRARACSAGQRPREQQRASCVTCSGERVRPASPHTNRRGSPQGPRTAVLIRRRQSQVTPDTRPSGSTHRSHRSTRRRACATCRTESTHARTPDLPSRHLAAAPRTASYHDLVITNADATPGSITARLDAGDNHASWTWSSRVRWPPRTPGRRTTSAPEPPFWAGSSPRTIPGGNLANRCRRSRPVSPEAP